MGSRKPKDPLAATPHVDLAIDYASRVVSGKQPACRSVVLACRRHLEDLKRARRRAFPHWFDPAAAERVCKFIEQLPHIKGEWAKRHELLRLEPWQCFKTCAIFGWMNKYGEFAGFRRFRRALIMEPRKNAKSTWAAAVGLYMLCGDREEGAEVYSGATSQKQAWEVFGPARLMAIGRPELQQATGMIVNVSNLNCPPSNAKFEPIIGKPGDGASPTCAIHDEYHEHQTDAQVDAMLTGMGSRKQPLQLIVTTAGSDVGGPCYAAMRDAERVLDGTIKDEELFVLIYTVDSEDDWTTEAALRKANPNYGVSVAGEFLLAEQRRAMLIPRKASVFKTKHLNLWVQARDAYFNIVRWQEMAQSDLRLDSFKGQVCRLGLDLASKVDIAALEIVFKTDDGFARFGRYYLPEATINLGENERYRQWVDAGWIVQTDGDMIDYVAIRDDILALAGEHQVELLAYDPHQAQMMVAELREEGVPCVEMRPVVLNFSEAMKTMDGLIRSRKIAHTGDPVFTWMLGNVVAKVDAKDNVYPRKERAEAKIDGPVAHIMVQATWLAETTSPSVYETRGLIEVQV